MNLVSKQAKFTEMTALLILYARAKGYQLTYGDAYRYPDCPYGHPDSLHKQRLAVDFNLFIDGKYITSADGHRELGEFWESLGGAWGGRFDDGNHYSLEHEGRR